MVSRNLGEPWGFWMLHHFLFWKEVGEFRWDLYRDIPGASMYTLMVNSGNHLPLLQLSCACKQLLGLISGYIQWRISMKAIYHIKKSYTVGNPHPESGLRGIDVVGGPHFLVVGGQWVVAQIPKIVGETAHLKVGYNKFISSMLVKPNLG